MQKLILRATSRTTRPTAIADLWDALAAQERREYTDYAEKLTAAVQSRLAALELPTAVTVNITLAPDDARGHDAYDDHAPATYPRNAIEQSDRRCANTPPRPRSRALP